MRLLILVLSFILIGLIVGYGIYGEIAGNYVNIKTLITGPDNLVEKGLYSIAGLTKAKQRILMCGAVGGVIGLLVALIKKKSSR